MSALRHHLRLVSSRDARVPSPGEAARIRAREHAEALATQIDRGALFAELAPTFEAIAAELRRAEELEQ